MKRFFLASLIVLFVTSTAWAVRVENFVPGGSSIVDISQKNLNTIKIPSPDIKAVTSSPAIDVKMLGEHVLVQYLSEDTQAAELILISKKGVFTLTLIPRQIPSQFIVIKDETADSTEAHTWETSLPYISVIKEVIKAMYRKTPPPGYKIESINKKVQPQWEGTTLELVYRFVGGMVMGDVYELKNVSQDVIKLLPQEFYSKGVLAVSIDEEEVHPNKSTTIYIVRQTESSKTRTISPLKDASGTN